MNLMPLVDRLEADGVGVKAKTLFINMIPVDAPKGVLLRNNLNGTPIDYELPGYFKTDFQVIARAPTYQEGDALIASVFDSLTVSETQIGSLYIRYMRPRTKPVVFPISQGNLLEFSTVFDVVFME